MKIDFTINENLLRELILELENANNQFSAKRDKDLLISLQMILTLSVDGQIEKLLNVMGEKFPEYGSL